MTNEKPKILDYIGKRVRGSLAAGILAQLLAFCLVLPFLAYQDALSRAKFLSSSSSNSLALMMSTGDIFQAHILLDSFISKETPYATVLDADNADIRSRTRNPYQSDSGSGNKLVLEGGTLSVITHHEIQYNKRRVGTLVLVNNIVLTYWFIVLSIFITFSILTFYLQSRSLKNLSVRIGTGILDLQRFLEISDEPDAGKASADILEIDILAEKIRDMMKTAARSIKMEKEAAVGRITSSLAHDMRVPLGFFERVLAGDPKAPIETYSPGIRASLNKLHSMIESLRNSEVEVLVKRSLERLDFEYAWESLNLKAVERNILLGRIDNDSQMAFIDPGKIERAWANLVSNAIEAAASEVRLEIKVEGSDIILIVMDDGPGVPEAIVPRLFSRGVTHSKDGGTGLGLAYVKQVAQGHGGDVSYLRAKPWTIFKVHLPNAARDDVAQEPGKTVPEFGKSSTTKVRQVSIMLGSQTLNEQLIDKLSALRQQQYRFMIGFDESSDVFVCNSSRFNDFLFQESARVILFDDTMAPQEILRRIPIRLGLKG